ncbi:alpha/beta fold hydrolase [Cohnella sp. CFH 77786]|uniref:alpha/beta fold hydrolase n=1 Tax=Cohnella sp. CFH 77786 TaxID=2662265 RepID=UPI001C608DB3|nr:alpha/beta fold hydrolase [Cohnella sp. CFH 77786]MBW5447912.1 alpha/beta fold hydrolase [Cohnella sp. CFH 77786]
MPNTSTNADDLPAYQETGSGVPVVLLHGFCGSGRYWDDVLPALSAKYRVIVPDLRGHGASPATEGVYTMERLADDTAALLDKLNVAEAFVFGHSLGGYATLAFAEQYPGRLLGFGLVHSTPLPDTEAGREGRLKAVDKIRAEGIRPFVDGLIPKLFAPEHRTSMADKVAAALEIGYATSPEGAVGCSLGMRERPDRTDVLRRTGLPVLLLAGEHDEVIPPERRFPVSKPNLSAVTLPQVGHMGMVEDPGRFTEALLAFLGNHAG